MNFKLTSGSYKSIKHLNWENIPDFVVLTGKNGSGKTQLLELMNFKFALNAKQKEALTSTIKDPFYKVIVTSDYSISEAEAVYLPANWNLGDVAIITSKDYSTTVTEIYHDITRNGNAKKYIELKKIILIASGKEKETITIGDVQAHLPVDYFDYINKVILTEGIAEVYLAYHSKKAQLRDDGDSEEDIKQKIGKAPWDILNDLLDESGFPYNTNKPYGYLGEYHFELISKYDKELKIKISDLSSGEKILISLCLWMFSSSKTRRLPKLLLMDEPDAHLHPSAVKGFLDVIEKVLVKKHKVRVIMTTHSPSTVSFAPTYSLFEMTKGNPSVIPLHSKEHGINLLTDGLIIIKSNIKHVLVEDKNDARFYNEVFKILKANNKVNAEINIIFIPVSNPEAKTTGGCTVVKAWIKKLLAEGAEGIFHGLIDSDNGTNVRESHSPLKGLFIVKRYSLENYLLDPIIVYASALHDNNPIAVPGIELYQKDEHKIASLEVETLQKIADYIFSDIKPTLETPPSSDEDATEEIVLSNGLKLNYPKWFIYRRGHNLYSKFKLKYSSSVNYDKLLDTIIRQELVSTDLIITINEIQK